MTPNVPPLRWLQTIETATSLAAARMPKNHRVSAVLGFLLIQIPEVEPLRVPLTRHGGSAGPWSYDVFKKVSLCDPFQGVKWHILIQNQVHATKSSTKPNTP